MEWAHISSLVNVLILIACLLLLRRVSRLRRELEQMHLTLERGFEDMEKSIDMRFEELLKELRHIRSLLERLTGEERKGMEEVVEKLLERSGGLLVELEEFDKEARRIGGELRKARHEAQEVRKFVEEVKRLIRKEGDGGAKGKTNP